MGGQVINQGQKRSLYEAIYKRQSTRFDDFLLQLQRATSELKKHQSEFDRIFKKEVYNLCRNSISRLRKLAVAEVELSEKIDELRAIHSQINISISKTFQYGEIPSENKIKIGEKGEFGIPDKSGVYFLWDNDCLAYIGQSVCLSDRVHLGHEKSLATDCVTFVEVERDDLFFAEAFYIGIGRPFRNGKRFRASNFKTRQTEIFKKMADEISLSGRH